MDGVTRAQQIKSGYTPLHFQRFGFQAWRDQELKIAGDFIAYWGLRLPDTEKLLPDRYLNNTTIYVRFNHPNAPALPMRPGDILRQPFERVYLSDCTDPAAPLPTGGYDLLWGTDCPEITEVINGFDYGGIAAMAILGTLYQYWVPMGGETYNEVVVGNAAAVALLGDVGLTGYRAGFTVQAESTNAGVVYVGFSNLVLPNKWWAELQAGQSCGMGNYRGAVWAIASAPAQHVGVGEW